MKTRTWFKKQLTTVKIRESLINVCMSLCKGYAPYSAPIILILFIPRNPSCMRSKLPECHGMPFFIRQISFIGGNWSVIIYLLRIYHASEKSTCYQFSREYPNYRGDGLNWSLQHFAQLMSWRFKPQDFSWATI